MAKIIALDIGGTNTRCALVNEKYEIEEILIKPTVVGNSTLREEVVLMMAVVSGLPLS